MVTQCSGEINSRVEQSAKGKETPLPSMIVRSQLSDMKLDTNHQAPKQCYRHHHRTQKVPEMKRLPLSTTQIVQKQRWSMP
jgi:hypothetical protein